MSAGEFEALVQEAVTHLNELRWKDGLDWANDSVMEREFASRVFSLLSLRDVETVKIPTLGGMVEVSQHENIERFLTGVENHPEAFDIVLKAFAETLEKGANLHPHAAQWLARVLRGEIYKKAKKGRKTRHMRNTLIMKTIEAISEKTGQVGRTETSGNLCALDVVLEALARSEIALMNYDNLKDIWEKSRKGRLEAEISLGQQKEH